MWPPRRAGACPGQGRSRPETTGATGRPARARRTAHPPGPDRAAAPVRRTRVRTGRRIDSWLGVPDNPVVDPPAAGSQNTPDLTRLHARPEVGHGVDRGNAVRDYLVAD